MKYNPHEYQTHATDHIIENDAAGLFLDMGLGKTVSTLTAVQQLLQNLEISRVLVIAPKKVAESTWSTEISKWDHLAGLRLAKILGTKKQREAALESDADIFVINCENVPWLVSFFFPKFPFDMVIIDELSSFKSAKAERFRALRKIRPAIKRIVGLTGTPAPNSLLDLWPQMYLLDQGQRLEKTITAYREKYFISQNYLPYTTYKLRQEYDPLIGGNYYERKIYDLIGDICISMKAEDFLKMPEKIIREVNIELSPSVKKAYLDFEKEQVLKLAEETEITAANAAALTGKLLQYSNGAIYDENKNFHEVHDEKLEALEEIIDTANGKPVLLFYSFRSDLERIKAKLKKYKPSELKTDADITKWNAGETPLLLAHPASAGHGLNLQAGGNIIVWFGLTWSLELYQQANARLYRQGQKSAVIIHRLVASGTMDDEVVKALDNKTKGQDALMSAVKAKIKQYLKNYED